MSSSLRGNTASFCGNKEALVAYLYGESDPAERDALDAHLLTCLTCATELRGLRGLRASLSEWTVPDVPLRIRVAPEERPRSAWWRVPVWAQAAAAALLVLAAAAAIANVEVRYGAEGLLVRAGWQRSDTTPSLGAMSATVTPGAQAPEWQADLNAAVESLRREMAARDLRTGSSDSARPAPVRATAHADADVLRRVQALIDASIERSEQRQQRELALRLQQLARDVELSRRADFARIEQSFGRMQVDTGAAIVSQRDWAKRYTDYVIRTSQRPQQ